MPVDDSARRPWSNHWISQGITAILVLILVVGIVLALIPEHYYAVAPGQAQLVSSMIKVKGYPPVHGPGALYMVDVTIEPVDNRLEKLYWQTQPDVELDPRQEVAGNLSNEQYIALNDQMMHDSIRQAEVSALELATGYKPHFQRVGAEVVATLAHSPAATKLKVGDVITAVNGEQALTIEAVSHIIKAKPPGTVVRLTLLRGGKVRHVRLATIPHATGTGKNRHMAAIVGIEATNKVVPPRHLPVKMSINPGNIGGPSAGLMFTLALVQRLEQRDIAHGCKVAGTGEIDWYGKVGAIGGARQKVVAAREQGARYFFVPDTPDNLGPARSAAHGITVVPVTSARQALNYLNRLRPCRP